MRYGSGANADIAPEPRWLEVADDGRYVWHDHRIHWMQPPYYALAALVVAVSLAALTVGDRAGKRLPHRLVAVVALGAAATVAAILAWRPPARTGEKQAQTP